MKKFILYIILGLLIACAKQEVKTKERFFFRNGKADMMVLVEGNISSNTFILLLHGGPGGNGSEYNFGTYAKLLEEQYAVVYLDQRGQGASQGNYDNEAITVHTMAKDVYELTKLLKAKYGTSSSIFLFGHSWGGMLGTAALVETDIQTQINGWIDADGAHSIPLLNKEAIKMFELYSQQVLNQEPQNELWGEIADFISEIDTNNITLEQGGLINSYGHEVESSIANITYDEEEAQMSLFEYVFINPTSPYTSFITGRLTSLGLYNEIEKKSYSNQLYKINIPCLFLWGVFDFVVPPALGYEAYEKVSTPSANKSLILYETSGHSPMSNEPEKFANDIIAFVERYK